jgi:hypothetical protein
LVSFLEIRVLEIFSKNSKTFGQKKIFYNHTVSPYHN